MDLCRRKSIFREGVIQPWLLSPGSYQSRHVFPRSVYLRAVPGKVSVLIGANFGCRLQCSSGSSHPQWQLLVGRRRTHMRIERRRTGVPRWHELGVGLLIRMAAIEVITWSFIICRSPFWCSLLLQCVQEWGVEWERGIELQLQSRPSAAVASTPRPYPQTECLSLQVSTSSRQLRRRQCSHYLP